MRREKLWRGKTRLPLLLLSEDPMLEGENKALQCQLTKPILRALIELGGSAHKNDVLDRVGTIMKNTLQEVDYVYTRKVHCGEHIRWPQIAAWQRHKMVEEGLLKSNSPKGVLDITEAGRSAFS